MFKNTTLSADESIIKGAGNRTVGEPTALNTKFRHWLKHYAIKDRANGDYFELIKKMEYAKIDRKFTRGEV
jgi:hypothetical protein